MNKLLVTCLLILAWPLQAATATCWEVADKMEQAMLEADGNMQLLFRDATSCEPVAGANIEFMGERFRTDLKGAITMPVPPDGINTSSQIVVNKTGYMSYKDRVTIASGSIWQTRFLLSKKISVHSVRFVLSWGDSPSDLDLHLKSQNMHISYRHMRDQQGAARLDIDAMKGYGPETITLHHVEAQKNYSLLVHQYSYKGSIQSPARVAVYANGQLDRVVSLDNVQGRCVQVVNIVDGALKYDISSKRSSKCQ